MITPQHNTKAVLTLAAQNLKTISAVMLEPRGYIPQPVIQGAHALEEHAKTIEQVRDAMETSSYRLPEVVFDITRYISVHLPEDQPHDSRELANAIIGWAREFEEKHAGVEWGEVKEGVPIEETPDYYIAVDEFAEQKFRESQWGTPGSADLRHYKHLHGCLEQLVDEYIRTEQETLKSADDIVWLFTSLRTLKCWSRNRIETTGGVA